MPKKTRTINTKNSDLEGPETTAKASKKPSLNDMEQSHGKDESEPTPTTLNQIWGDDGSGRYKTLDETEYRTYLQEMSWSDLRSHASQHGLIPVGDRVELEKKLIKEFKAYAGSFNVKTKPAPAVNDVPDKVKKILEEGR
tara:strand:+ start:190 stop:609 length:420 start_codon:yes stop_codon:yes gene_type:complete